jgi:4-amino-4-deoxy-L-arabinose transferase-like glycosyltransferase
LTELIRRITHIARDHAVVCIGLAIYGVVICLTYREYGITNDEALHIEYGEALIQWFVSLGEDAHVLTLEGTVLYGGLFDIAGLLAFLAFGGDPYETKHLCNAFMGLLGVVAAYRIGTLLGGKRAGLLAAVILVLTPRYYGHAFNNPKDIPFAVFYLWSVYYLMRLIATFPRIPVRLAVSLGVSIGLTLAIRIGGVVLFAYAALFLGLCWIGLKTSSEKSDIDTRQQIMHLVLGSAIAGAVMYLFWPLAQVGPLTAPFEALSRFSNFPDPHWSFFNGKYISSIDTPRTYVPLWMIVTLPESIFLGLIIAGLLLARGKWRQWRSPSSFQHALLGFAGLFPIAYAVLLKPALYDGVRHFLFAVPPLAALAGIAISRGIDQLRPPITAVIGAAAAICILLPGSEMIRLHPNQTVYFNHLFAGTVDSAWLKFETDYWRHSQKQALGWIADRYVAEFDRPVRIASRFIEIQHQMPSGLVLVDFRGLPDFYVGSTRFEEHRVIPGEVVHIIRAGQQADMVYIVRPDDGYIEDPFFTDSFFADLHRRPIFLREAKYHESLGDPASAARSYLKLSRCYERLKPYALDLEMTREALAAQALGYQVKAVSLISEADALTVAERYLETGNYKGARDILQGLVKVYPDNETYPEQLAQTLMKIQERE